VDPYLSALAFADDALLLAHSAANLQALMTAFENFADEVGLKINMGKGKTERFVVSDADVGAVSITSGAAVPVVDGYRYLGVQSLDFETEFAVRTGKAWAALKKFHDVWKSNAPRNTKRLLFRVLVEPILTYGLGDFGLTATRVNRIDGLFGSMLRYAVGLPSVKASHRLGYSTASTEEVYGDVPFLSATISLQRLKLIAKALQSTRDHPLIRVLEADTTHLVEKRRRPVSVLQSTYVDLRIAYAPQLLHYLSPAKSAGTLAEVAEELQAKRWAKVHHRRQLASARALRE
jgi:hypothetical protein